MTALSRPLYILVFVALCVYLFLEVSSTLKGQQFLKYAKETFERSLAHHLKPHFNESILDDVTNIFCHSDGGIIFHKFRKKKISPRNCIGYCRHKNPNILTFLEHAIDAPHVTSLCTENPFHGFYDCLWPLVHYLVTCLPLRRFMSTPVVITNNAVLSEERYNSWAVQAQTAFLDSGEKRHLAIERNRVPGSQCICFSSVVRFGRKSFWRPVRYQFTYKVGIDTILSSHPMQTKRNGLVAFRDVLLARFNLNSRPLQTAQPLILIYGREDVKRRTWRNIHEFMKLLHGELHEGISILYMKQIPTKFEEQVSRFNAATVLIAPHGAAMVNTLFMRRGSAVLEISSKHCSSYTDTERNSTFLDTDTIANTSDPNSWVPWHSQSLGIYHVIVPCTRVQGRRRDFETENKNLLQLVVLALLIVSNLKH